MTKDKKSKINSCDKDSGEADGGPRLPDNFTAGWKNLGITFKKNGFCISLGAVMPGSVPGGVGWGL